MNDLTPIPPSDPGFQLMEPMANNHAPSPAKFRLHKFLFFLRKFWWIPLVTLVLSTGVAVALFFHTPPTFVSYGSMAETEKLMLPDGATFTDDRDNFIGTMIDTLRSQRMWSMTTNYMLSFKKANISFDEKGNVIPVNIQVFATPKSSVYVIEARSANPAFTPAYLDALMEQYKEFRLNARGQVSSHTFSSISDQIQIYERDLKAAQAALADYERSNNFVVLQQESTIEAAHLGTLKTQLSDYQLQIKLLDAKELEMDSGQNDETNVNVALFDSLHGAGSTTGAGRLDANRELELLQLERTRLAKYLRPKHPKMVKLNEDISRAQKTVEIYQQQSRDQILAARKALQIKIDDTGEFVKEWEAKVADANTRLANADVLKQEVLNKQKMYDRLTALNDNVQVGQHIDQDTLDILDLASPATRSYAETKTKLVQSVIMGLGLGLGIVFLIAWRDDRFTSVVEVVERFGDNVVGQVPEAPLLLGAKPALLEDRDDRHVFAESYRNLRSALLYFAGEGRKPQVVMITSAVPNEGKSTVATNLARALALGGSKVLLIDGDMRKGHIHEALKLQSKPGLAELLRQPVDPEKYLQATDLPGFTFLSRGGIVRNPGDLLLNSAIDQLFQNLRSRFDHIIVDSGPVFAADDTATVAPKVDGILFVVRSRFSHSRVVREALEVLFQRQARVLGLILNRSNASTRAYHYYQYGEYHLTDDMVEVNKDS